MVLWGDLQEGFYWVSLELQWKAWEGREEESPMFLEEAIQCHSSSLLYFKDRGDSISQVTLLQAAAYVCQFCALSVK